MKRVLRFTSFTIAIALFALSSCKKNEIGDNKTPEESFNIPTSFMWKTTKMVNVNINSSDVDANGYLYKVSIYESTPTENSSPLYSGALGYGYPYNAELNIPSTASSLYLKIEYPNGGESIVNQTIVNNSLSYTIATKAAIVKQKSSFASGPDCSSGCDNTISGSGSVTITGGKTYCINSTFNGSLNFEFWNKGGTVRICGNATITSANLGANCNIVVAEGGTLIIQNMSMDGNSTLTAWPNSTVSISGLNMNSSTSVLTNYSNNLSFNNGFSPNGSINNYGKITIAQNLSTGNNDGALNNSGTIQVTGNIELNQGLINNGTIEANGTINVNVLKSYTNNCQIISHNNISLNNGNFICNNGLVLSDKTIQVNGSFSLTLQNQSMIKAKSIILNAGIKGSGSLNSLVTTQSATINGSSIVSGAIEWADINGTLTNGSVSNFSNGATFVKLANATNYIPTSACNTEGIGTPKVADKDGDGVADLLDDYPTDPERAFDNYFPGKNEFSTFAFEDLWPSTGDYDFNDLVVNAQIKYVTNARNLVVDIVGKYYVAAVGGSLKSGFALQFDKLLSGDIKSVKRSNSNNSGYIKENSNGTENGPDKAAVILWDNTENMIHRAGGSTFNAITGNPVGTSDTLNITITFVTPKTISEVGTMPLNHFMIRDLSRKVEIHLPNAIPTSLANYSLFGTEDDASNPAQGKYYITKKNLPWALYLPRKFNYPNEKTNILDAFLKFKDWAKSGGSTYQDWYINPQYINYNNIYKK